MDEYPSFDKWYCERMLEAYRAGEMYHHVIDRMYDDGLLAQDIDVQLAALASDNTENLQMVEIFKSVKHLIMECQKHAGPWATAGALRNLEAIIEKSQVGRFDIAVSSAGSPPSGPENQQLVDIVKSVKDLITKCQKHAGPWATERALQKLERIVGASTGNVSESTLTSTTAGLQIDPESAEVMTVHWQITDREDLDPELKTYHCAGREYFARYPGSDKWVDFHDLPEATGQALRDKHKSKLAFPAESLSIESCSTKP